MAAKNFLQLTNDALQQADEQSGSGSGKAALIIQGGINEAYADIAGIRDWKTLENSVTVTTSAGTNEYTPVTASASTCRIRRIQSVLDQTSNRYVEEIRREDFETEYPYVDPSATANQGSPLLWYQSGYTNNRDMKISLYPVPNSARSIKVIFTEEPLDLSGENDIPRIPDEYHFGLTYLGLAKYYEFQKDFVANYYRSLHNGLKQDILSAEFGQSDEMPAIQPISRRKGFIVGKIGRIYN